MTTVEVTEHSENVFNLIPRPYKAPKKPPRHQSMYHSQTVQERKANIREKATMGPVEIPPPNPSQYLRKQAKLPLTRLRVPVADTSDGDNPCGPERSTAEAAVVPYQRPPQRHGQGKPVPSPAVPKKNYIKENALETIRATPPAPCRKFVDSKHGDTQMLEPSGLEIKYVFKKNFGKLPLYIERRRKKESDQKDYQRRTKNIKDDNQLVRITEQERTALIKGLKENWAETYRQFQALPLVIDNVHTKMAKASLESRLAKLEQDIKLLEENQIIFIADY